jgi:phosphatidylglycerophosphate synthase
VIAQAVLYLATADDLHASLLRVAGRPVAFRVVINALRAGARRVGVPPVFRGTEVEHAIRASPRARAAVVWLDEGRLEPAPTLLVPATTVTPPGMLAALMRAAAPGTVAEGIDGAPAIVADAASTVAIAGRLAVGAPVGDAMGSALATCRPAVAGPDAWHVCVRDGHTARSAEQQLLAGLGSPIDTRLDKALHRRLSRHVTRAAVALGIRPNAISVASLAVGLLAVWCFWNATWPAAVAGLLVYVVAVVLDHADGEVARLTLAESRVGEWLDIVVDTVVHATLVYALGTTAQSVAGGGAWLGALGAAGIVASAAVAKLWPVTGATDRVGGLLDSLGSRDGFYAMLLLFIAARALAPSALPALMVIVALGAHGYWLVRAAYTLGRA